MGSATVYCTSTIYVGKAGIERRDHKYLRAAHFHPPTYRTTMIHTYYLCYVISFVTFQALGGYLLYIFAHIESFYSFILSLNMLKYFIYAYPTIRIQTKPKHKPNHTWTRVQRIGIGVDYVTIELRAAKVGMLQPSKRGVRFGFSIINSQNHQD